MSVIVKHMAMPDCCYECKFRDEYSNGSLCIAYLNKILNEQERLDTCPLIDSLNIIEMINELINNDKLQASPIVWHTLFVIKGMLSEERK